MSRLVSLGIEPYEGKQLEDPVGPIDAVRRYNGPFEAKLRVPTATEWVQLLVGSRANELDSMRLHHRVDSDGPVRDAAVLRRWILNGEQALKSRAEADVVLDALRRSPSDPVDPVETAQARRSRDGALHLARARVVTRRGQLT